MTAHTIHLSKDCYPDQDLNLRLVVVREGRYDAGTNQAIALVPYRFEKKNYEKKKITKKIKKKTGQKKKKK